MTLKLYCFGESGHSYKVALALSLLGLDWVPVHVDFFNGGTRTPEFRKLNEMGECPVLVDGDTITSQSGVILFDLAARTGKLAGETDDERRETLRWTLWDNHKMSGQIGTLRFLMNFLPETKRDPNVIAWLTGRTKAALTTLNTHLNGRDWIVGRGVTLADLSCSSYLFYPEEFTFDRADWPNIDRWLTNIEKLPGWKHPYALMQRAFGT